MESIFYMITYLLLILLVSATPSLAAKADWGYYGENGPENWHRIDPDFALCKNGKNQTPIDIKANYDVNLAPMTLNYAKKSVNVTHTGYTIRVDFAAGNTLVVDDMEFALQEAHFHAPGENRLNGVSYPFEAHLVHQDAQGNLAVVAVFYTEGEDNAGIAALWPYIPAEKGQSKQLPEKFDALDLLPKEKDYVYFNGSLTTPPCSEGVRWYVLKKALTMGKGQQKQFVDSIRHPNNRPLQPVNARVIVD